MTVVWQKLDSQLTGIYNFQKEGITIPSFARALTSSFFVLDFSILNS